MWLTQIAVFLRSRPWVLHLLFLWCGTYLVACAVNAVVASEVRVTPSLADVVAPSATQHEKTKKFKDFSSMAERNLLGAERESLQPEAVQTQEDPDMPAAFSEADVRPCTLPVVVRGTMVAQDHPQWSVAVIYMNKERKVQLFTVNSGENEISPEVLLTQIRPRELIVWNRDHYERCATDTDQGKFSLKRPPPSQGAPKSSQKNSDTAGVKKISDTQYEIERREIDHVLGNLSQIATQARIVPNFKNGKSNGFKIFAIKSNSLFQKIGLKNGDVIQSINGYVLDSPDKALEMYQKLREASNITIDIQRRGRNQTMRYNIGH